MDDTIKIVGSTTVTPMTVPDLAQTDEKKADFVKNKKISYLENDSNFTTKAYVDKVVPTKVSELTNDMNYWCIYNYQPLANALNDIGVAYKSNIPEVPTKVSQLENDAEYWIPYDYQTLGKALNGMGYVRTDNNFTNELKKKVEDCHIFSENYGTFVRDLMGVLDNAFNVASRTSVKSYVDEKLGVIENGSY